MKNIRFILSLFFLAALVACQGSKQNFLGIDAPATTSATDSGTDGRQGKAAKIKKSFQNEEYDKAIKEYSEDLEDDPENPIANYYIAESYRRMGKVYLARDYYAKAIAGGYNDDELELHYAKALKANADYAEAERVLENYLEYITVEKFSDRARRELANLKKIDSLELIVKNIEINEAKALNTENLEYSPFVHDKELYFATTREEKTFERHGVPFSDIYKASIDGLTIDESTITRLPDVFNDTEINEGTIAISPDGNTLVFAKGNSDDKRGLDHTNLFISTKRNGQWSSPQLMPINSPDNWDSSPAFSRNGQTLYFASDRPGGYGGSDIYRASLNERGRWGNVTNMGAAINTAEDEVFPYISPDNKLYFASDGHIGFGMLDIFVAVRKSGQITIENMGPSVNSAYDDFGLVYSDHPYEGFFTSNRPGGTGGDDIYTLVDDSPEHKKIEYVLKGRTYTPDEDGNPTNLGGVRVKLLDENLEVVDDIATGRSGVFQFPVDPEKQYFLLGEKTDYFTTRQEFSMIGKGIPKEDLVERYTLKEFEVALNLDPIVKDATIVLENIFYDLNKADIREDAALELDKLVQLLKDNPEIKIELSSHTDSRADNDFNQDLSQRRAQAAVDYIVSKGIARDRMVAKGYGETQLLNGCDDANAASCTEEQHQENRRTEFKVIEYNKEGGN